MTKTNEFIIICCEHSRHGVFNALIIIDGIAQKLSAFELVKSTLVATPDRSVIGFHDNSSSINGYKVDKFVLVDYSFPPVLVKKLVELDIT